MKLALSILAEQRSGIYFLSERVVLQEWSRSTLNSMPVPFVVLTPRVLVDFAASALSIMLLVLKIVAGGGVAAWSPAALQI